MLARPTLSSSVPTSPVPLSFFTVVPQPLPAQPSVQTGEPSEAPPAPSPLLPMPVTLSLHDAQAPDRAQVEAFIRGIYQARYGAQVTHFAPMLASLRDAQGTWVAAVGWRPAATGPLFLERYLDRPVEQCLRQQAAAAPARHDIVEVGHLAASRPGEGRRLVMMLGPVLAAQGFQWVVGTLTQELRHLFVRLGVAPLALGVADPHLLGDEAAHWGSYYDHRPVVLAGHLASAMQALSRREARA